MLSKLLLVLGELRKKIKTCILIMVLRRIAQLPMQIKFVRKKEEFNFDPFIIYS